MRTTSATPLCASSENRLEAYATLVAAQAIKHSRTQEEQIVSRRISHRSILEFSSGPRLSQYCNIGFQPVVQTINRMAIPGP